MNEKRAFKTGIKGDQKFFERLGGVFGDAGATRIINLVEKEINLRAAVYRDQPGYRPPGVWAAVPWLPLFTAPSSSRNPCRAALNALFLPHLTMARLVL